MPRLCTYLAALYLQVSSFLSWGAFSNVLEGCSGWKCSELNPLGTASSCGTQLPCPSNEISEARVLHHFPEFLCGINLHAPTVAADLTATLNWLPCPAPSSPLPITVCHTSQMNCFPTVLIILYSKLFSFLSCSLHKRGHTSFTLVPWQVFS